MALAVLTLALGPALLSTAASAAPVAGAVRSEQAGWDDILAICDSIETQARMQTLARQWSDYAHLQGVAGRAPFDAEIAASLRQMEAYVELLEEAEDNLDSFLEENEDTPPGVQEEVSALRRATCAYLYEAILFRNRLQILSRGGDPIGETEQSARRNLNALLYEYMRFRIRSEPSRHATLRAVDNVRKAVRESRR